MRSVKTIRAAKIGYIAISAALCAVKIIRSQAPAIIVSGMGLFAATFGVALYSDIDIISSMCMLMARGAVVSMLCVLLMLCDGLIRATTLGMKVKEVKG